MSNPANDNTRDTERRSGRSLIGRGVGNSRTSRHRFANLSLYAFGLSGLWTAVGAGILPFKVLEALELGRIEVLGTELDKNGALGMLSLLGLLVAAGVQLGAGAISDKERRPGGRLPYLLVGGIGVALITVLFGIVATWITLLMAIVAMQLFGNFAQGPANALIVDYVPKNERGAAAVSLNLWRLLGAGSVTVIVLQFMARYDKDEAPEWLWFSLVLVIVVVLLSMFWTVLSIRPESGLFIPSFRSNNGETQSQPEETLAPTSSRITKRYVAFLIALAFALAAMSAMQIYTLFFLQDVVGLDNPADGADLLVIVLVTSALLTVLPTNYLASRFGRSSLFIVAGICGASGSSMLIFVSSIGSVLLIGVIIGVSVGLFMTLTWAVANDLVRRASAARELGYTSIATFAGTGAARFAGIGIDELNSLSGASENLGYKALLVCVATAFVLSAIILAKVANRGSILAPD
jgi:MFS family permease